MKSHSEKATIVENYSIKYLRRRLKHHSLAKSFNDFILWARVHLDALSFLLDNVYIRFGTKLYKQIVGIPMGTNCAPLVADLFFILL